MRPLGLAMLQLILRTYMFKTSAASLTVNIESAGTETWAGAEV